MAEHRLIDANALRKYWLENGENEYVYDTNSFLTSLDTAPTIDPETIPIVRQLRAELARVKKERDAAVGDLTFAVNKYRLFTTDINLCCLCKFDFPPAGKNEQTYECPGCHRDNCFEWRGPRKEE